MRLYSAGAPTTLEDESGDSASDRACRRLEDPFLEGAMLLGTCVPPCGDIKLIMIIICTCFQIFCLFWRAKRPPVKLMLTLQVIIFSYGKPYILVGGFPGNLPYYNQRRRQEWGSSDN